MTLNEVVVVCLGDDTREEELEEAESPKKKNMMNIQFKVDMDMCLTELMSMYS